MSNSEFCRFFRNGLVYNNNTVDFTISPCCYYNSNNNLIKADSTNEQFNLIRDRWLDDDIEKVCHKCIITERAQYPSYRLSSFDICSGQTDQIEFLTVAINKTCNLACASCSSGCSSFWYQENLRNNIKEFDNIHQLHDKNLVATNTTQFIKLLQSQDLSQLKYVKFGGGEPMMNNDHIEVLKLIPYPENVTIQYTSNFSIMPGSSALDLWNKFRLVKWWASTDGVEEQFELLRWPYKWNKFSAFVKTAIDQVPGNVMFGVEHTLNPLNIYYFDQFERWFNQEFSQNRYGDVSDLNLHTCHGEMSLTQTPLKLRQAVEQKYGQEHTIVKILQNTPTENSCTQLINHMDTLDLNRGHSWRKVFLEVENYFHD